MEISSRFSVTAVNVKVLEGAWETMRSLCGMLVSGGVSGCRKGWRELRKDRSSGGFRGGGSEPPLKNITTLPKLNSRCSCEDAQQILLF